MRRRSLEPENWKFPKGDRVDCHTNPRQYRVQSAYIVVRLGISLLSVGMMLHELALHSAVRTLGGLFSAEIYEIVDAVGSYRCGPRNLNAANAISTVQRERVKLDTTKDTATGYVSNAFKRLEARAP